MAPLASVGSLGLLLAGSGCISALAVVTSWQGPLPNDGRLRLAGAEVDGTAETETGLAGGACAPPEAEGADGGFAFGDTEARIA